MNFINDTFYHGLTVGLVMGMTLNMIKNYIFKSKLMNHGKNRINASVGSFQPEAKSSTKLNGEFKMALLVRHDLKMGKGKVAAQVSCIFIFVLGILNYLLLVTIECPY